MVTPDSARGDDFFALLYMDCTNPPDSIGETLACVCFRCRTEDEDDYTRGSQTVDQEKCLSAIGKWLGVEPFSSIQGSVGVLHTNYGIQLLGEALHWLLQELYIDWFRSDRRMHIELCYVMDEEDTVHFLT